MTGGVKLTRRMTYERMFAADGHDEDCAAHNLEPCDCISGIVRIVDRAFQDDLSRILSSGRSALQGGGDE